MTIWVTGFFRCECGKIHCHAGIWWSKSLCKCGRSLKEQSKKWF